MIAVKPAGGNNLIVIDHDLPSGIIGNKSNHQGGREWPRFAAEIVDIGNVRYRSLP